MRVAVGSHAGLLQIQLSSVLTGLDAGLQNGELSCHAFEYLVYLHEPRFCVLVWRVLDAFVCVRQNEVRRWFKSVPARFVPLARE